MSITKTAIHCGQTGCTNPATHRYVWTDYQYICQSCLPRMIQIAEAMGFPTPAMTLEPLVDCDDDD